MSKISMRKSSLYCQMIRPVSGVLKPINQPINQSKQIHTSPKVASEPESVDSLEFIEEKQLV